MGHFKELPSDEELQYGKENGWLALKEKRTASKNLLHSHEDKEGCNVGNPSSSNGTINSRAYLNSLSDESESDSDGDTSSSESQEE